MNYNLFENDGTEFWSKSVFERLNRQADVQNKRKNAAKTRWQNANAKQMQCKCNANADDLNNKIIKDNNILLSNDKSVKTDVSTDAKSDKKVDFDYIISLYHELCPEFPRVVKLSERRKRKIEIRIQEMGSMDILKTVFEKMGQSKFLKGDNPRSWKASFDWVFANESNWVKIVEGNYDNRARAKKDDELKNVNDIWQ